MNVWLTHKLGLGKVRASRMASLHVIMNNHLRAQVLVLGAASSLIRALDPKADPSQVP